MLTLAAYATTGSTDRTTSIFSHYADSAAACEHGFDGQIVTLSKAAAQRMRLANNVPTSTFASQFISSKSRAGDTVRHTFSRVLDSFSGSFTDLTMLELASNPDVARIDANCIVKLSDPITEAAPAALNQTAGSNPVSGSSVQDGAWWGLDRIDSRGARDGKYDSTGVSGSGVRVYVLDTGVRISHEDFGGRAIGGHSVECKTASSCTPGWVLDGVITSANAASSHSHGTHCASTVAGTTYGVAKGTLIVTVQVLSGSGSGSLAGVIAGIEWSVQDAATHSDARAVLSMSLGGDMTTTLNNAVKAAYNAGVVVVAAAGNNNGNACSKSPASAPEAITVGSTTSSDAKSSFSNHGSCVDIHAPGSSIKAAWASSDTATNTISGTSMATPHVAGAVALLLGKHTTMTPSRVATVLDCMATRSAISGLPSGTTDAFLYAGAPMAADSYAQCATAASPPPPPPAGGPGGSTIDVTVTIVPDSWPEEISWRIETPCVDAAGPFSCSDHPSGVVAIQGANGQGRVVQLLRDASFTFQVFDSYGDGILPPGGYAVSIEGNVLVSNYQNGWQDSTAKHPLVAAPPSAGAKPPPPPPLASQQPPPPSPSPPPTQAVSPPPPSGQPPLDDSCFVNSRLADPRHGQLIVGGEPVPARKYEWLVSLQANGFGHFCGGTLISPTWVLTAAHCTQSAVSSVKVGMDRRSNANSDGCVQTRQVLRTINHPSYNAQTLENDLSLLELASPVDYAPVTKLDDATASLTAPGTPLTVAGWGTTSSGGQLSDPAMQVSVPVVSNAQCNAAYGGAVADSMMCAGTATGGKDSCQGDSGGPLFGIDSAGRRVHVGIVSWGRGCALADFPGVYTRVASYRPWLCAQTGTAGCAPATPTPSPNPPPPPPSPRPPPPLAVASPPPSPPPAGAAPPQPTPSLTIPGDRVDGLLLSARSVVHTLEEAAGQSDAGAATADGAVGALPMPFPSTPSLALGSSQPVYAVAPSGGWALPVGAVSIFISGLFIGVLATFARGSLAHPAASTAPAHGLEVVKIAEHAAATRPAMAKSASIGVLVTSHSTTPAQMTTTL